MSTRSDYEGAAVLCRCGHLRGAHMRPNAVFVMPCGECQCTKWEPETRPTVADVEQEVARLRALGWTREDFARALREELTELNEDAPCLLCRAPESACDCEPSEDVEPDSNRTLGLRDDD